MLSIIILQLVTEYKFHAWVDNFKYIILVIWSGQQGKCANLARPPPIYIVLFVLYDWFYDTILLRIKLLYLLILIIISLNYENHVYSVDSTAHTMHTPHNWCTFLSLCITSVNKIVHTTKSFLPSITFSVNTAVGWHCYLYN